MEQENEIQKVEPVSPLATAAELVKANGDMDVAKLKELLELQERWEANQAKKAYVVAMSAFKESPPEIDKDSHVNYQTTKGITDYHHASLYNVTSCINKALSKHGLTASWVTSQDEGLIKVTCKIRHVMGHSESTCLSAPPDNTGSKNAIQAIGSTVTYLQRYTVLALTGLATYDQDDDGGSTGKDKAPAPKQKQNEIVEMAFLAFESKHQAIFTEPKYIQFEFDRELFKEQVIKHSPSQSLPTNKASLKVIEKMPIKPEDCLKERE